MTISLSETAKRFNREWIFHHFSYTFNSGNAYAITGPNGSGKSTLLQVIGGAVATSSGKIQYSLSGNPLEADDAFKYLSFAAPYLELIEEMSVLELLSFHQQFKPFLSAFSIHEMIHQAGLTAASGKQIRYYSSGMKQRVKLLQAICSDTPCVLLDEPCTNLDEEGVAMYRRLISQYCTDRLVIVSSNDLQEYTFCNEIISILDYK